MSDFIYINAFAGNKGCRSMTNRMCRENRSIYFRRVMLSNVLSLNVQVFERRQVYMIYNMI